MCDVCDKLAFALETLESLFPVDELLKVYATEFDLQGEDAKKFMESKEGPPSAHANFICMLVCRYAIKHKLPPQSFSHLFYLTYQHELDREIIEREYEKLTGKKPDHRIAKKNIEDEYGS